MKQRAIRGGIITSVSQVIMFVLRLASIMVLARLLIPEHFGLIGMVTALTVFIERFQDIGLGDAVVQRKEITHEQVSTLFWPKHDHLFIYSNSGCLQRKSNCLVL